jgi:hypothetical protein
MSFLKHIGQVAGRKCAIIYREVPGEQHMALVVYTETLNRMLHDSLIKCIESDIGQHSESLADALNRSYTQEGKIILHVLHTEGMLKKVKTVDVIVTPAPNQTIKLNELNTLLNEMQQGEDAIKRMKEIDSSRGMQDPADIARRMNQKSAIKQNNGALSDSDIAQQMLSQAEQMERDARGLLAEATRLKGEVKQLAPSLITEEKASVKSQPKKAEQSVSAGVIKKTRGRPRTVNVN